MNVCDEAVAIDVVKEILMSASKEIEMRQYKRHTELVIEDASLGTIEKATLFGLFQQVSLPHETKLVQTKKFNNPDHPCKVLIGCY